MVSHYSAIVFQAMFARVSKWFVVAALVCVLGGHWAVLQVAAWTGMAISYSQNDSVGAALSKTFDGKHHCKMCQWVTQAKNAEGESKSKLDVKKLDSFLNALATYSFPPLKQNPLSCVSVLLARIAVPPSPPPRLA